MITLSEQQAREAMRSRAPIDGVAFPDGFRWDGSASGRDFSSVSLAGVQITGSLFTRVRFAGCSFRTVNLSGALIRKADFRDCEFVGVQTEPKVLTAIQGASFIGCTFDRASLSEMSAVGATFERCRFESLRARRVRWRECKLADVVIGGTMETCNFVSSQLKHCDFTDSEMRDIGLVKNTYEEVRFPERPENFFVPPGEMSRAFERTKAQFSVKSREELGKFARIIGASAGPAECVHRLQFGFLSDHESEALLAALYPARISGPLTAG